MDNSDSQKNKLILIKKASGDDELFATDKLQRSLRNAGAEEATILKIVADIEDWIYSGVTTKQIYSRAFLILRRERTTVAMRYKLKQAIIELGPSGYPFESFIGQLFEKQGFEIEVGVVVDGYCVTHEMDVIATHNKIQNLVECKYHKDQGKQVSVQVPLYVHSRVNDIIRKRQELPEYQGLSFSGWIVTNTSFSLDSIKYSTCNGLKLLAWDYPRGKGLKYIIEHLGIYPLTILHHLTKKEKDYLMKKGIVTCAQLQKDQELLNTFQFSTKKMTSLLAELEAICA